MNNFGHVELDHLGDWYKHIEYSLHPDPLSGFNFVDPADADRYKTDYMCAYISRDISDAVQDFFNKQFGWLTHKTYSVQKLKPGMLLPRHTDAYAFFSKTNNISDLNDITRVIVFLDGWHPGHISEVGNEVNTKCKAGDWVSWVGQTPHMAANLGHVDRYTLQITGTTLTKEN